MLFTCRFRPRLLLSYLTLSVLCYSTYHLLWFVLWDPLLGADQLVRDQFRYDCDLNSARPFSYPDAVDLRIVVITQDRPESLAKLLASLNELVLDPGDLMAMEIWIDQFKRGGISAKTLEMARNFTWRHGLVTTHVHCDHVGLYGQWIDTWRPRPPNSTHSSFISSPVGEELALILEDDLSLSPYAWLWLKAAHKAYGSTPTADIVGYTLQSEEVMRANGDGALNPNVNHTAFLYQLIGSWGFAPHPTRWAKFQDWYYSVKNVRGFKPYVDGLIMTDWYKTFEKRSVADSMWTMWMIKYAADNRLYVLYNNLNSFYGNNTYCLAVNRQEAGLHYTAKDAKSSVVDKYLISHWDKAFIDFPADIVRYDFDGDPAGSNKTRTKKKPKRRFIRPRVHAKSRVIVKSRPKVPVKSKVPVNRKVSFNKPNVPVKSIKVPFQPMARPYAAP